MLEEVVAVSKTNSDKQDDAEVLRAQDIVPLYNKKINQKRDFQKMETDDVSAEGADVEQKKGKIPKFDLAKEIMAEQRKITAIRRKAPAKAGMNRADVACPDRKAQAPSRESGVQSVRYTIQPPPTVSEQEQIIAEIVARDIEKLCRGNA
jgi:hypothetical protein